MPVLAFDLGFVGIGRRALRSLRLELALRLLERGVLLRGDDRVPRVDLHQVCAMIAPTEIRANHLRSAGITYHGAHSVLVCESISENAFW